MSKEAQEIIQAKFENTVVDRGTINGITKTNIWYLTDEQLILIADLLEKENK